MQKKSRIEYKGLIPRDGVYLNLSVVLTHRGIQPFLHIVKKRMEYTREDGSIVGMDGESESTHLDILNERETPNVRIDLRKSMEAYPTPPLEFIEEVLAGSICKNASYLVKANRKSGTTFITVMVREKNKLLWQRTVELVTADFTSFFSLPNK